MFDGWTGDCAAVDGVDAVVDVEVGVCVDVFDCRAVLSCAKPAVVIIADATIIADLKAKV